LSIHHPEPHPTNLPWLDHDGEEITELSINDLLKALPEMLTWPTEPDARASDLIVFRFSRTQGINENGHPFKTTYPDIYLRITANPIRHRKGHWQAPFVACGFDRTEPFMRRYGGTTPNRLHSIDRDVPLVAIEGRTDKEADLEDVTMRHPKRLRAIHARAQRDRTRFKKKAA